MTIRTRNYAECYFLLIPGMIKRPFFHYFFGTLSKEILYTNKLGILCIMHYTKSHKHLKIHAVYIFTLLCEKERHNRCDLDLAAVKLLNNCAHDNDKRHLNCPIFYKKLKGLARHCFSILNPFLAGRCDLHTLCQQ